MNPFTAMFASPKPEAAPKEPDTTKASTDQKNLSDPNPTKDANGNLPGTDGTQKNPLDIYAETFENARKSSDIQAPSFKLDSKVLNDVSKTMDFTKGIAPDLLEKALGGDVKALMGVMQAVGQNSYSASLEHATALTDTHLGQRAEFESARVNKGVRSQLTNDALSSTPNYDHPVVKQELNRVANQFAAANPDASPAQIAKAAQKYMTDLHMAMNPSKTAEQQQKDGEMDWSKYIQN